MTIVQLKTWWRIQRRMFWLHFFDIWCALEFPVRFVVNWIFLLTAGIWLPPVYIFLSVSKALKERKCGERAALTGRIWFWEQFKQF